MIISSTFVQTGYEPLKIFDPGYQFEHVLADIMISSRNAYREYETALESIHTQSFFSENADDDQLYIEAGNNLISKLGNAVITLAKKFSEMCDKAIEKIKEAVFKMKSDESKIKYLQKEYPELSKMKIKQLAEEGGLNFSDLKSFADLDRDFYKLMKLAESDNVDYNTFKGKCKLFEAKIKNNDTKLQTAAAVAGSATAVIALGAAIIKFRKSAAEIGNDIKKAKAESEKTNAELFNKLKGAMGKELNNDPGLKNLHGNDRSTVKKKMIDDKINKMGKYELLVRLNAMSNGKKNAAIGKNMSILQSMKMNIAKSIDSALASKAGQKIAGDVAGNHREVLRDAAERAAQAKRKNK